MKAIRKIMTDADKLERRLAGAIERLAAELDLLPQARDDSALDAAWRDFNGSRRELSVFLKAAESKVDIGNAATTHQRQKLRNVHKDLKAARAMLGLWTRVKPIVSAQRVPKRRELIESDVVLDWEPGVQDQVVSLFLQSMHKIANPHSETQGDAARDRGCHRDIPYPMYRFSQTIGAAHRICLALRRNRPFRFLDVGSGGGTKVLAATTCFDLCDGLEYDETAVATGRRFLGLLEPERCRLIHGDALRFSDYDSYDVIYYYRPMMDPGIQDEMEKRILSQVGPGTLLLKVGGCGTDELPSRGARQLAYQVYVTGMTENDASELVSNAERMGPMVPYSRETRFSGKGYWKPLLKVSARNGYYI